MPLYMKYTGFLEKSAKNKKHHDKYSFSSHSIKIFFFFNCLLFSMQFLLLQVLLQPMTIFVFQVSIEVPVIFFSAVWVARTFLQVMNFASFILLNMNKML